jgi:two-component system cell cycle response regulator DivK
MAPTILCIEDNPNNMLLVRSSVEVLGCRFLWAASGATGLELAEMHQPDLILLDINLPDMDGYQVARLLRARGTEHLLTVPIIVLTANALMGEARKFLAAGCTAYIPKPIDTRALRAQIMAFLPSPN